MWKAKLCQVLNIIDFGIHDTSESYCWKFYNNSNIEWYYSSSSGASAWCDRLSDNDKKL